MPRTVTEYRCLLISPSDVAAERDALAALMQWWNAQIGSALGARVDLVRWETHSAPDLSDAAQTVLNQQIVAGCDLGIALFWSRVGTPTSGHESGSLEEIHRLLDEGARVMVYFKGDAIPQAQIDLGQLERLQQVKAHLMEKGVVGTFQGIDDLKEKALLHLTSAVSDLLSRGQGSSQSVGATADVLPKPNIRIRVQPALASDPWRGFVDLLVISIENHSPITVYLGTVSILLKEEKGMLIPRHDSLTRRPQSRQALNPGQRFSLNLTVEELLSTGITASQFDRASVVDDIGRTFHSEPDEFAKVIETVIAAHNSRRQ